MALPRFWWLDNTDADEACRKLAGVKKQLESWDWVRWEEAQYETPDKAFLGLMDHLGTKPMFCEGKVVYSFGLPRCHADLADEIENIPNSVLFILISRPDTKTNLYKNATKLKKIAKIEKPLSISSLTEAVAWIRGKASRMGVEIEEPVCKMLIDRVGTDPGRLSSELRKLSYLTEDKKIHDWVVREGCYGTGDADVIEMCESLVRRDYDAAHRHMKRLLDRGEEPLKICGYLMDWTTKMALADSVGGNYNALKPIASEMRKFIKGDKAAAARVSKLRAQILDALGDEKKTAKLKGKLEEAKEKAKSSSGPMFPNVGALYYSCKSYGELGFKRSWAYWLLSRLGELQQFLRTSKKDSRRLMHGWLDEFRRTEEKQRVRK